MPKVVEFKLIDGQPWVRLDDLPDGHPILLFTQEELAELIRREKLDAVKTDYYQHLAFIGG